MAIAEISPIVANMIPLDNSVVNRTNVLSDSTIGPQTRYLADR